MLMSSAYLRDIHILRSLSNLKILKIGGDGDTMFPVAVGLKELTSVTRLVIDARSFSDDESQNPISYMSNLTDLGLSAPSKSMLPALACLSRLQRLDLGPYVRFTFEELRGLVEALRQLRYLRAAVVPGANQSLQHLVASTFPRLQLGEM